MLELNNEYDTLNDQLLLSVTIGAGLFVCAEAPVVKVICLIDRSIDESTLFFPCFLFISLLSPSFTETDSLK